MSVFEGECLLEQTYTGSCGVGEQSRCNEVEFVLRDIFRNRWISVRDVRCSVCFEIDVLDGLPKERYYVHVVVRCSPYGVVCDELLDVSSRFHVRTFSGWCGHGDYCGGYGHCVDDAYVKLMSLYTTPVSGVGVWSGILREVGGGMVDRRVVRESGIVSGMRGYSYECSGLVGALGGKRRMEGARKEELGEVVTGRRADKFLRSLEGFRYNGNDRYGRGGGSGGVKGEVNLLAGGGNVEEAIDVG